eukprot:Hpha_TRINITY_DN2276_c0_g1::TRINITY_DN2276_c0_g1_i1::g.25436::m.25436
MEGCIAFCMGVKMSSVAFDNTEEHPLRKVLLLLFLSAFQSVYSFCSCLFCDAQSTHTFFVRERQGFVTHSQLTPFLLGSIRVLSSVGGCAGVGWGLNEGCIDLRMEVAGPQWGQGASEGSLAGSSRRVLQPGVDRTVPLPGRGWEGSWE